MAVPALGTKVSPASGMIRDCALLAGDLSTASGLGLDDTQWTVKINDAIYWYVTEFLKRTESKTLVASFSANAWSSQTAVTAADPEILEVSAAIASDPTATRVLEWMPWAQIRWRQARKIAEGGTKTATYPQFYSLQKESGQSGRWRLALWPAPTAATQINGRVRVFPVALSASTDTMDGDDHDVRIVERIAAAWGAEDLGDNVRAERIVRTLPQQVRAKLMSNADVPDPQRRREPVSR